MCDYQFNSNRIKLWFTMTVTVLATALVGVPATANASSLRVAGGPKVFKVFERGGKISGYLVVLRTNKSPDRRPGHLVADINFDKFDWGDELARVRHRTARRHCYVFIFFATGAGRDLNKILRVGRRNRVSVTPDGGVRHVVKATVWKITTPKGMGVAGDETLSMPEAQKQLQKIGCEDAS